ncbi:hypothetical protein BDV59DRAFT_199296 [Aspergillus ambiguus]|uniref:uncharacterized protein n=1 Tax=Aspergillus ambiguus TaxID=176160 RepID=UPI003CCCD385
MFRRRRSASHHQPLSSSATQSAQSAASHAFLNSHPSSSSLSSAAAAAALRSLTPTPTPIENVQTKRMVQRRASVTSQSSLSSALRPTSQNGVRRARSSSSMSNRTFREQSPRRPPSSGGPVTRPPLPSIPPVYRPNNLPRRSVSVGPSSTRHIVPGKRPASSAGRGLSVDLDSRVAAVPELQRPGSRSSINFSYPMNSRPNSPTRDADRRDASTGISLVGQLASSETTANPSVRKTTRTAIDQGSPGRAILPVGTAVAAAQAAIVPRTEESVASSPSSSPRSAGRGRRTKTSRASPEHDGAPSSVEVDMPVGGPTESGVQEKEAEPVRMGRVTPDAAPMATPTATPDRARGTPSSSIVSTPKSKNPSPETRSSPRRQPSSSPGRSARFSAQVAITEQLHQPPPRSVSPAKSAMKNSRKSSLSPDETTVPTTGLRPGPPLSEISDGTSVASDDGGRTVRRRPAKVSFDDEAEVVGVAASPPTSPEDIASEPSPPGQFRSRPGWFGVAKRKPPSLKADELDELLTPRPVLPSFGSIRGRNGRPPELIQNDFSDNESTTSSESSPLSFSNDHAVGGILVNTLPRVSANTTLNGSIVSPPPAAVSEPKAHPTQLDAATSANADTRNIRAEPGRPSDVHPTKQTELATLTVPGIEVQPATPEINLSRSSLEYTVPGGFPRSSSEIFPSPPHKQSDDNPSRVATHEDSKREAEGTEADDESGESIYSDAEEGLDRPGFGSINAIVDGQSAAGPPKAPAQERAFGRRHAGDQYLGFPGVPDSCQVALPVSTSQNVVADLKSPAQPFPFPASNQPPINTRPMVRSNSTRRLPRSAAVTNLARRSVSVDISGGSAAVNATSLASNDLLQPEASHGASFFRQKQNKGHPKKRALSWGPVLFKSGKASPERSANDKTSHLRRRPSNGSDSSSSFKRSFRPRAESQHIMRRSLRATPANAPAQAGNWTPAPGSGRPISSGGIGPMRSTLRTSEPRPEKAAFFSTGKVPKARTRRAFTSRFADSDDEIGDSHTSLRWRSRYGDSSDEDHGMVQTLRPVRGIPRRHGMNDGDSTELEDSSDNDTRAAPAGPSKRPSNNRIGHRSIKSDSAGARNPAFAAVARSRGMTEDELDEFMHQPSTGRRPSLFRRLSLRKNKTPPGRTLNDSAAPPRNGSVDHEAPRLDESNGTVVPANKTESSSPKLHKKRPDKSGGEDWPLQSQTNGAPRETSSAHDPPTLNGAGQNGTTASEPAPQAAEANHDAAGRLTGEGRHLASNRSYGVLDVGFGAPRQKRFPRLRKAFGLH